MVGLTQHPGVIYNFLREMDVSIYILYHLLLRECPLSVITCRYKGQTIRTHGTNQ